MAKPEIMVMNPVRRDVLAQLDADFTLLRADQAEDQPDFIARSGAACRAMLISGNNAITSDVLDAMPALAMISCSTAGYDALPVDEIGARGIALTNTSPALRDDVADMGMLLLLAARRGFVAGDAYVRSGDWARKGMYPLQRKVSGSRLGIVGMGSLGSAVARRAEAFGMQIGYWNRREKDVPWTWYPDLVDLAKNSDALILTIAGGPETEGLIGAEVMAALGPQGLLVNIARGSVVDEAALIDALESGALGHAALDVYRSEPDPDPRLTALPNVTLSPHHASGTEETRTDMARLAADNLRAFFAGKELLSPVAIPGAGA
ncbi:2-hydroxyacid dehydrogenase [Paracoccus aurantiacus]|uniref:2-hydroxyacid dehydrogenase n=1 Tax=Paracoccus aurantiacus TaxID=2599412 RepID=UPI00362A294F